MRANPAAPMRANPAAPMRAKADPFAPPALSPEQEAADKAAEDRAAASALVDCAICLECVMSKERIGERRFGLLSGCSHAFCLACIRGWRDGGTSRDAAEHTAGAMQQARRCPICREVSFFIAPAGGLQRTSTRPTLNFLLLHRASV